MKHHILRVLVIILFMLAIAAAGTTAEPLSADISVRAYLPLLLKPASPSTNLLVSAATYLGGPGADSAGAVDIAPDGTVVFGGVLAAGSNPGGVTPIDLLGGGDGAVVRLDRSGGTVLSIARVGSKVADLEINAQGMIVVCGDFGLAALNATASTVLWNKPGPASRCAISSDGTVAALVSAAVVTYDGTGTPLGSWNAGSNPRDIAVDSASKTVIATGWKQDDGGVCSVLQVAYIHAYSYAGQLKWRDYDWNKAEAGDANLCADTRGAVVAIGHDGKLYFAGTSAGGTGASIFARDPHTIGQSLGARAVATDAYNTPSNINGAAPIAWYGRYNPADGTLEQGASLLTRLPASKGNKGNGISIKAITADENGRIFIAGDSACCIENRDARQVAGIGIGPYESGEAYLVVITPDLKQRLIWNTFAGPAPLSAGGSPAVGVGARTGIAAVAITLNLPSSGTRALITHNPLQSAPGTLPDAYVAVWPQR